eukprot:PITA_01000
MAGCEGGRICIYWWVIIVMLCSLVVGSQCAAFNDLFYASWAADHVMSQGDLLQLKLDHTSGAGFASKSTYLFGKVNVQIKLVPGDSAGTVTAFYMSSQGDQHDEFDFEFLGNTSGEPYVVQTNVYSNGVGNREQRIYLWFDPTANFHSYSFLWNRHQAVFFVDDVPIRVFSNNEKRGVPFPQTRPMGVYSSIWNADDWATQGGRVKTDWSHAPFISTYTSFNIDACKYSTGSSCTSWWDRPAYASLNAKQRMQVKWVQQKYMIYDYCKDTVRFATPPAECTA